ncbi:hypothetical protein [Pseudonocardia lacus]|uniref:hypothetical protein n=1 Tax=Pseudonocardia lacus TaxID=2835865 RepID=UPI001BDD36E9|nr:hypothetical protein [Pseudonocardia lacus]
MKVRFAPRFRIYMIAAGVATMLVCLVLAFTWSPEIAIIIGAIGGPGLIAYGWLFLGRVPYVVLTDAMLTVPIQPAHGRTLGGGRLAVDGNRLVIIRSGEKPRKLPVYRWYSHPDDRAAVVEAITHGGGPSR